MKEIFYYIKSLTTHTIYPKTKEMQLVINLKSGKKIILSEETSFMHSLDEVLAHYGLGVATERISGSYRKIKRLYALDIGYDPTNRNTYRTIYAGKPWHQVRDDAVSNALWDMTGIDPSPTHDNIDSIREVLGLAP